MPRSAIIERSLQPPRSLLGASQRLDNARITLEIEIRQPRAAPPSVSNKLLRRVPLQARKQAQLSAASFLPLVAIVPPRPTSTCKTASTSTSSSPLSTTTKTVPTKFSELTQRRQTVPQSASKTTSSSLFTIKRRKAPASILEAPLPRPQSLSASLQGRKLSSAATHITAAAFRQQISASTASAQNRQKYAQQPRTAKLCQGHTRTETVLHNSQALQISHIRTNAAMRDNNICTANRIEHSSSSNIEDARRRRSADERRNSNESLHRKRAAFSRTPTTIRQQTSSLCSSTSQQDLKPKITPLLQTNDSHIKTKSNEHSPSAQASNNCNKDKILINVCTNTVVASSSQHIGEEDSVIARTSNSTEQTLKLAETVDSLAGAVPTILKTSPASLALIPNDDQILNSNDNSVTSQNINNNDLEANLENKCQPQTNDLPYTMLLANFVDVASNIIPIDSKATVCTQNISPQASIMASQQLIPFHLPISPNSNSTVLQSQCLNVDKTSMNNNNNNNNNNHHDDMLLMMHKNSANTNIPIRLEPITNYYEIDRRPFARGKFAQVKKCVDIRTGQCYAAKCIKKSRRCVNVRHEILLEIEVLKLSYVTNRIISLYEVFETETEMILVLELATGGELQRILDEEEYIPEITARKFVKQILEGLEVLHNNHIAHLDIKPQNLLITNGHYPNGDIKLCDFGISRQITKNNEIREICGTPDYVAPEILNYDPISFQTDMWSVGVLTYVLITGFSPFGSDNKQQTFLNITQVFLEFPDECFASISTDAIDFIRKLIVQDPKERLTCSQALMHPWFSAMTVKSNTVILP